MVRRGQSCAAILSTPARKDRVPGGPVLAEWPRRVQFQVYTIRKNAFIPPTNPLLHNHLEGECIQPAMWATLCLLGKL